MVRDFHGFTLLESLMLLGLLALVAAPLLRSSWTADTHRAVRALQAFTLAARIEAVRRNAPVAVVYLPDRRAFQLRSADDQDDFADPCAGSPLRTLSLRSFRRVTVFQYLRDDLVWLPSGRGRSCSGSGVFNGSIVLGADAPSQRLVVSSAGRIRTESLP